MIPQEQNWDDIIATEMSTTCHSTAGPVLERPSDLVGMLSKLEPGDVEQKFYGPGERLVYIEEPKEKTVKVELASTVHDFKELSRQDAKAFLN